MFELIDKVLALSDGFCEVRVHEKGRLNLMVRNGQLETSSSRRSTGAGIRVIRNGAWGFASTSELSFESLAKTLKEAETAAKAIGSFTKVKLPQITPAGLVKLASAEIKQDDLSEVPAEEKIKLCLMADGIIKKASALVVASTSVYNEYVDEKWIGTTDGAKVHIRTTHPEFYAVAVASKDGQMQTGMVASGVMGNIQDLFACEGPEKRGEKAAKLAVEKLSAPYIPGGVHTVILKPAMVGILAHEAIGHTVEADFVQAGSIVAGKIGQKLGSELITMVDSGKNVFSKGNPSGTIAADDEGVATEDTVIIEKGVLKSYLHNRETAARFGVKPTGNARAWSHTDTPIIRMRNTYIMPGVHSLDEMATSIEKGYILDNPEGGQADSNAEFMFGCSEVYEIKNGKIGQLMRGATMSGQAFNVLQSVDMVGSDFEFAMGSGFCGKGQPAKVDGGGPSLRCQVMIGGR